MAEAKAGRAPWVQLSGSDTAQGGLSRSASKAAGRLLARRGDVAARQAA